MADSKSGSPDSYSSFLVTVRLSRLVSEIFIYDRQTTQTITIAGPRIMVGQLIKHSKPAGVQITEEAFRMYRTQILCTDWKSHISYPLLTYCTPIQELPVMYSVYNSHTKYTLTKLWLNVLNFWTAQNCIKDLLDILLLNAFIHILHNNTTTMHAAVHCILKTMTHNVFL